MQERSPRPSVGHRPESRNSTQRRRDAETQKDGNWIKENEIATIVIAAAIEVHRTLGGPGLLEIVYEKALAFELESRVIVECKATTAYNSLFEAQALTYLRLCDLRLALVVNFGERQVRQGIHRLVNGLQE
jgi:hypothetical protein